MSKNDDKKLVSLIDENDIDENEEEPVTVPKKSAANVDILPTTSKSTLLEVNKLDKYKSFLINKPETQSVKPSEALSRVRQFLPMLKESTDKLLLDFKDKPDELNIENVGDEDEHIEMNVAFVPEGSSDDEDEDDSDEQEEEEEESEDDDESSSDEEDNEIKRKHSNEDETSSPEPFDQLGLGFKYKTKMKLKLNPNDENVKNKKLRKNLIEEVVVENNNNVETKNVDNSNNNNEND